MLRVLLATPVPPPESGGIINWSRIVCRELKDRSDLELLLVDTARRYRNIPGFPNLSHFLFGSSQALKTIYQLFRKMRKHRPAVLHINTSGSYGVIRDLWVLYIAKMLKIPCIVHYHLQKPPAEISNSLYWKLLLWTMSLAKVVVLLDYKSLARAKAVLPNKTMMVLPNMVEFDVIENLSKQQHNRAVAANDIPKIMFVGFVVPHKGVRELLHAWLKLPANCASLEYVGKVVDPHLQEELESLAAKAGRSNELCFRGAVKHEQVLGYLMSADIFVLPSYGESAPMVVLEAMGCSRAIVGSFTGAIPEMLDIGGGQECGICVTPKNTDELAAALSRLLNDPQLRETLGQKARQRAEQMYSVPVGCKQLLDLWRSMVKS
jgi:glycosyltransferase involved in cell wall biosynthesis